MFYNEFIRTIKTIALNHSMVNQFLYQQSSLNSGNDIDYAAFGILTPSVTVGKLTEITLTMFYIDRLTDDRTNMVEIQTAGIQTLTEITNALKTHENVLKISGLNIRLINEGFANNDAGCFAEITITVQSLQGRCFDIEITNTCNDHFIIT